MDISAEIAHEPYLADIKYPLPPLLIISLVFPGRDINSQGLQIVMYGKLSSDITTVLQRYSDEDNLPECIPMLSDFINNCTKDNAIADKLKISALLINIEDTALNFIAKKMISKYNGKSFAPGALATYEYVPNQYFSINIDCNNLPSMGKKGFEYIRPELKSMIYNLGFHIAGTDRSQLPERIFACVQLSCIGWEDALAFPYAHLLQKQVVDESGDGQIEDELHTKLHPIEMEWLLRYNLEFRIWCVKNLLWTLLDVLALLVSLPSLILRPLAFRRNVKALYYEHKKDQISWMNLGRIFVAGTLNSVLGLVDMFFYLLFMFDIITVLRAVHILNAYKIMIKMYDDIDEEIKKKKIAHREYEQNTKLERLRSRKSNTNLMSDGYQSWLEKYIPFLLATYDTFDRNQNLTIRNLVRYDLHFRWLLIYNIFRAVFDWCMLLLTSPVIMVVSRTWSYFHIIWSFKQQYMHDQYMDLFRYLWLNLFISVWDLLLLPMGVIGVMSLTRHSQMKLEWSAYFRKTIVFDKLCRIEDIANSDRKIEYESFKVSHHTKSDLFASVSPSHQQLTGNVYDSQYPVLVNVDRTPVQSHYPILINYGDNVTPAPKQTISMDESTGVTDNEEEEEKVIVLEYVDIHKAANTNNSSIDDVEVKERHEEYKKKTTMSMVSVTLASEKTTSLTPNVIKIQTKVKPILFVNKPTISPLHWSSIINYDHYFRKQCFIQWLLAIIDTIILLICLPSIFTTRFKAFLRCYLLLAKMNVELRVYHLLADVTDFFVWRILLFNGLAAVLDMIMIVPLLIV